jgi:dTDP-4-amino-4,6-dideoxygalactose transaminase
MKDKIPFLDLVTTHIDLEEALMDAVREALRTASFVGGPNVDAFEREFAEFCGARHAVGVGSGTDALRFAIMASGVQPGDTVLTVPNTFIATTEAITQSGARPEFLDVDEASCTMDPRRLREYLEVQCITDRKTGRQRNRQTGSLITAVIPVHLYGNLADMDPIMDLASEYKLIVIEDACQAHGAEYFSSKRQCWRKAGSIGHAAAFSFYPAKNLGACGEAGAVTTDDELIARKCRAIRDHGQTRKYCHDIEGYNGRLDAIQAAILRVKLRHLDQWTEQRRKHARTYDVLFADCEADVQVPARRSWSRPVYHLYVIRVACRERVQNDLDSVGIGTGIHYPIPLHLTNAYACLGYRQGAFPVTERIAAGILSLPMFPGLTLNQQRRVVKVVAQSVSDSCGGSNRDEWPIENLRGAQRSSKRI